MEIFSYSIDLARIVFLLGAVLAMVYKKRLGITPGGIIVPAFLALFLDQSFVWFVIILAVSLLTRFIYKLTFESRALPRIWVVFTNICISALLVVFAQLLLAEKLPIVEAVAVGFVIPGLIGANSVRYGTSKVFKGTLLVTALTYAIGVFLASVLPFELTTSLTTQLSSFTPLKLTAPEIYLPASLLVTGVTMYKFGVRTGGYLLAPFIAILAVESVLQMAAFAVGALLSYLILQFILKYSLLVGLERFMVSLFLATFFITLTDILAVHYQINDYRSSAMVLMVAMGVIVNDLCLQKRKWPALSGVTVPVALSFGLRMAVK